MKHLTTLFLFLALAACSDELEKVPVESLPPSTTKVNDKAVIKVMHHPTGWVTILETLQPQYLVTMPDRELSLTNDSFGETSKYKPPQYWSLIDAVVHPSGQISIALAHLDVSANYFVRMKIVRLRTDGTTAETELTELPKEGERTRYFPGSLDRVKLESKGEDVYVVSRWNYNQIEASRLSFRGNEFSTEWQKLVEPDAYAGTFGIIGGGYDNFHQGDRYFFVFSGVDSKDNLYVAVASHEELLSSHDELFNENLSAGADPGTYDWGVALVTKLSPDGDRQYSKLLGSSSKKRLVNMRVADDRIFLVGREKVSNEPDGWDAWILSATTTTGTVHFDRLLNISGGDMFWNADVVPGKGIIAVGSTAYTQNPAGLSVSDQRLATAILLNGQGEESGEIELPQGPSARGSEAMFVTIRNGSVIFSGVHNAPGTHASVYTDGFIAVRDIVAK